LAKQILNTGIRHTSVDFTVTDEFGNIISKSTAKDMKNGKVYGADDEGNISVPKHKAGHFHFTISAAGYADIDLGVDVKQGMSNEFSVKMKKSL